MIEELRKKYLNHYGFSRSNAVAPKQPIEAESLSEKDNLLAAIYSVDPVTKLPTGDIACYVSSNTSPEVKKFILDNIMMDTSSAAQPSIPEGISDDDAFQLSRNIGEDINSYMERLNKYTERQLQIRDTLLEDAKKQTSDKQSDTE